MSAPEKPDATSSGPQPAPTPAPSVSVSRRLGSASNAALELHQHWGDWSAALGKFALQASFALMAANWAIHGSQRGILANVWARWSMAIGFIYLGLLLVLIAVHVYLLKKRHLYADSDRTRWQAEYDRESSNVGTAWPYTASIDRNGDWMRFLHIAAPLVMGCLLLTSVFFGNTAGTDRELTSPGSSKPASSAAGSLSPSSPSSASSASTPPSRPAYK